jgi:hypothetical protein
MNKRATDSDDCVIERKISWQKFTWLVGGLLFVISVLISVGYSNTTKEIDKKLDKDVYYSDMKAHIEKNELQFGYIQNSIKEILDSQKKIERNTIMRYDKNESIAKGRKN